jgi:carbonic anhydrase/acetyltransferase-like protein (isoleucine patch superfamily)
MDEVNAMQTTHQPQWIANSAWIADTATVVGQVYLGEQSSIWFGAVVRGDVEAIRIGQETNVQDLACLHADPGQPCTLGDRVTVGHGAIVHGATVEDECLIGMGAIILNGARIGAQSIVGAGSLVAEGKIIPPRSLVVGTPGRVIRQVTDDDVQRMLRGANHYVEAAQQYKSSSTAE